MSNGFLYAPIVNGFFFLLLFLMFICLCWVSVVAHGIFDLLVEACNVLVAACGIEFLDQGSKLGPLCWEFSVSVTGPPGKSLLILNSKISFPSGTCFSTYPRHEISNHICYLCDLMLKIHWFYSKELSHSTKFHHFHGKTTDNLKAYPLVTSESSLWSMFYVLCLASASLCSVEMNERMQCIMESEHYNIYGVISTPLGPIGQITSSLTDVKTAAF